MPNYEEIELKHVSPPRQGFHRLHLWMAMSLRETHVNDALQESGAVACAGVAHFLMFACWENDSSQHVR